MQTPRKSEQFRPAILHPMRDIMFLEKYSSLCLHRKCILTLPNVTISSALQSAAENCARIKNLGFTISKHITMYGEHFELVSDPFTEGDCTAVHAITQNDPGIRTLRLPVATLIGLAERFRKPARLAIPETL